MSTSQTSSGLLAFNKANKSRSIFDVDTFRLERKGDAARIALLDEGVTARWSHYIRNPDEEGPKGGYVYCHADVEELEERGGIVPDSCYACANVDDERVSRARRRLAIWIAVYRTNRRGELEEPLGASGQVWLFSDGVFGRLIDRAEAHGDLRKHDIRLTCVNPGYQQFDMDVQPNVLLAKSAAGQAIYKAIVSKRPAEMHRLLGREVDVEKLVELVDSALGAAPVAAAPRTRGEVASEALDDLLVADSGDTSVLDEVASEVADEAAGESEEGMVDFGDLLKGL